MAIAPMPIIVGAPRSGTTLLRAMLDSHPELAMPPESYFLVGLARRRRILLETPTFDPASFADMLIAHHRFALWGLDPDDTRLSIYHAKPSSFAEGFRVIYGLYAQEQGKVRYGDKTPWYVYHIGFLSELFPEAKFIHVIRDGRDVTLSQGTGELAGALAWRKAVRRGRVANGRLGPRAYMELRYEDLIRSPEIMLRTACDFLHLEFDRSMLDYRKRAHEMRRGFHRSGSVAHRRLSEPLGLRSDNWKVRMTPTEAARFEELAGRELVQCGYHLSGYRLSRLEVVRTHADSYKLTIRSIGRRTTKALGEASRKVRLR